MQRFLYVGKGSKKPIGLEDFYAEEEDEVGAVPLTVISRIWKELKSIDAELIGFFKSIIRERGFPLRLSQWEELTGKAIAEYYQNEHLAKLTEDRDILKNFADGDKLYGIHDIKGGQDTTARPNVGRYPQMRELEKLLRQAGSEKHVVIDTINGIIGVSAGKPVDKSEIKDLEALKYLEFLSQHPAYGPKFFDKMEDITHSCKAALEFVTQAEGNQVHFELSGIDLAQIAGKTDKSVTGSELRSIFRRVVRGGWKPGRIGINPDKIIFYKFGNRVPAPWDQEPELWADYAKHVQEKGVDVEKPKARGSAKEEVPASAKLEAPDPELFEDEPSSLGTGKHSRMIKARDEDSIDLNLVSDMYSAIRDIIQDTDKSAPEDLADRLIDAIDQAKAKQPPHFRSKVKLRRLINRVLVGRERLAESIADYLLEYE